MQIHLNAVSILIALALAGLWVLLLAKPTALG